MSRPSSTHDVALRPLTARSVVLSVLLGVHPPELPVRELVRVVQPFDISDATLRVALTRMVAAGDLHRTASTYRLSDRLVERQRRQDDAIDPHTEKWDGTWEIVAITATGRGATDRAALRTRLTALRLGELREGLWIRPANLARTWPSDLDDLVQRFLGDPQADPRELARSVWDLDRWADAAATLVHRFRSTTAPVERFTLAAAIVRTLLSDPVLPDQLLSRPWPADALRESYRRYQEEFINLSISSQRS